MLLLNSGVRHKVYTLLGMAIFEFHIHQAVDVERLLTEIKLINLKLSKMATKAEFQQALTEVTDALENIAADITPEETSANRVDHSFP
jgi:hypothetical protein